LLVDESAPKAVQTNSTPMARKAGITSLVAISIPPLSTVISLDLKGFSSPD
jgi:hypothetical protein